MPAGAPRRAAQMAPGTARIAIAVMIFPPICVKQIGNRKNHAIDSFLAEGDNGEDEAVEAEDEHTEGDDIAEGHGGGDRVEDEIEA